MGKLVAILAIARGLWLTLLGFIYANSNNQAGFGRYVPGRTTGEAIDAGLESILFGIVMGILCHIAVSVSGEYRRETTNSP
jgi:hypothetical protein